MSHTKGRMSLDTDSGELLINDTILIANVYDAEDDPLFPCCDDDDDDECDDSAAEARANAIRIVACWNAIEDASIVNPAALPELMAVVEAIPRLIDDMFTFFMCGPVKNSRGQSYDCTLLNDVLGGVRKALGNLKGGAA